MTKNHVFFCPGCWRYWDEQAISAGCYSFLPCICIGCVCRGSAMSKGGVQYTQGALPEGENGILLFIRQNGKVFRQRMVVNIKPNRYQRLRLRITP